MRLYSMPPLIGACAYIRCKKSDSFRRRMRLYEVAPDIGACACKCKSTVELCLSKNPFIGLFYNKKNIF